MNAEAQCSQFNSSSMRTNLHFSVEQCEDVLSFLHLSFCLCVLLMGHFDATYDASISTQSDLLLTYSTFGPHFRTLTCFSCFFFFKCCCWCTDQLIWSRWVRAQKGQDGRVCCSVCLCLCICTDCISARWSAAVPYQTTLWRAQCTKCSMRTDASGGGGGRSVRLQPRS